MDFVLSPGFRAGQEGHEGRSTCVKPTGGNAVLRLVELPSDEFRTGKVPSAREGCGFNKPSASYAALIHRSLIAEPVGMNSCFQVFGNFRAFWKEQGSVKYGGFQNRLTVKTWDPLP